MLHKSKMVDMGRMRDYGGESVSPVHEKPKMVYDSIYLSKVPDELMGKDVGDFCRLEIVVKISSKSINESDKRKTKSMTLDLHQMGVIGPAGKKTKEEYLAMNPADRESYDSEQIYKK